MRRRIILYIVGALGGILVLCMIIGALSPKSSTPNATPTIVSERAATIALPTEPPPTNTTAPSPTARPTRPRPTTVAPSVTPVPSATPAPTKVPPTQAPATQAPPTAVPATAAPAASCPGGCTEEKPGCAIKGNVNSKGERIYHKPGMRDYSKTKVQLDEGDRWFCTDAEAQAAGFRIAER